MTRCEECKANKVCDHNRFGFENCGNFIPNDVVPKSEIEQAEAEIERLKHILNCYALQYGTVTEQQAVIDKANQKFASEIFAEIERLMENNEVWFRQTDEIREDFSKLKKKYIGG
jgi:hypothetical protein